MKKIIISVFCTIASFAVCGQSALPHLAKQGDATQLIVEGKPFIMLGGELGNSSAASLDDMEWICPKMQQMQLNTILVPAYWELLEPEEGKFDFSLIDGSIALARKHDLKIVFLWFGAWKNSMSCYAPVWVKENVKRYPRAMTSSGQALEIMTAFDANNLKADAKAFARFMKHIAEVDKGRQTVIMVQVENEIGMLRNARDYRPEANAAYNSDVPVALTDYLAKHKATLRPALSERWAKSGFRTKGKWEELFGEGLETEEIFMAWHYGLFIREVARAGKAEYPLPMYLNAALNSRGRKAGEYPSAGPLAHLLDVWRAAAPAVDFLSPDIYDPGFTDWCKQYHVDGNPLFIPEIRLHEANAARAFYAFGEHDAMGFSPFSIEDVAQPDEYPLTHAYRLLRQLMPLLTDIQGKGKTRGVLLDGVVRGQTVSKNGYTFTFNHYFSLPWENNKDTARWGEAGAILIELSATEYLVAGSGVVVTFGNERNDGAVTGISSIDEVAFDEGKMKIIRRLNGDQNHQGRHLRIPFGKWSIQRVRLYDYK